MIEVEQFRKKEHDIDPVFINRWSPRSFSKKEVPEEVLMRIFEAARFAPSANNLQPWRFIIAQKKEDLERFHSFILEGNLIWCEKAPVIAVLISDKESGAHVFDAGTAWGYLALQATKEGLISHAMGGIDKEKARKVLNIPNNFDVQIAIAIGYQGDKVALPENLRAREYPSSRRPLKETIFEGEYR
ncbi:nitroreductase family protein [Bacillus suaedaesalsae]|uniref:Nitroreductase family protein n=1 Tax=Bacillus suaedaesalsae TaxID=2810349 RepID=A0ABS2DHF9_9BACI|nr:nitroreductase family protein [Bacillus suaedaesalsae]